MVSIHDGFPSIVVENFGNNGSYQDRKNDYNHAQYLVQEECSGLQ